MTAAAALVAHRCHLCGKTYQASPVAVVTCTHANTPRHAAKPTVATITNEDTNT